MLKLRAHPHVACGIQYTYMNYINAVLALCRDARDSFQGEDLSDRFAPLVFWHTHVRINRRTEHGKAGTAYRRSLRPRVSREDAARQTAAGYAIVQVVLGAQALDGALGAGEDGADFGKVLAGR